MTDTTTAVPRTYVRFLLPLLCLVTFFEGYDYYVISLILADLGKEFGVAKENLVSMLGWVNASMLLGFFVVRQGDSWGRKPILLLSIAGYGVLSLTTAFVQTYPQYVAVQLLAKIFLVAEYGMASLIASEEVPPQKRGMAVALVQVSAALGAALAFVLTEKVLGAGHNWRALYLIGAAPLALVPLLFFTLRETAHFTHLKAMGKARAPGIMAIWRSDSKRWVVLLGVFCFLTYLGWAALTQVFPLFMETEMGLSKENFATQGTLASVLGMTGFVVSGFLMDRIGRRVTAAAFFLLSATSLVVMFNAAPGWVVWTLFPAMFFTLPLVPIATTMTMELFPTADRAAGTAWSLYLFGRPGQSAAPWLIGWLAAPALLGSIGTSVTLLAAAPVAAALLVVFLLPERKGVSLDDAPVH